MPRVFQLNKPTKALLEKMVFERLLIRSEIDAFAEQLLPHQLAITSEGYAIVGYVVTS